MSGVELTFLGTGTSNGVPVIGCGCDTCTSTDPRDGRSRTSAFIHDAQDFRPAADTDASGPGRTYLIDTATELRLQVLAHGPARLDAVLMTHAHADHTGGFDDLRRFNELQGAHLPIYANPVTAATLRERFAYAFADAFPFYGGKPDLTLHEVTGPFAPFGREIVPVPVFHGRLPILGYRVGHLAYVTDAKTIPPGSLDLLRDLDILVLNALREAPHPTHLSIAEALAVIAEVRPRAAYLIHLSHELRHAVAEALLPPGVHVAHDGLTVSTDR
ncbi:MAG: MBL fold metallo-hydrolase [Chloroflexia bacterium]|nr:MBL fold metallo-hydrolase [Chloroflexia bacterium]MDQ3512965.1 MBL fold metallo-hydrolase [Chloroflexota bacterium]